MDYIQKAIDKARDERQRNIDGATESKSSQSEQEVAPIDDDVLSINYTKTKQVELSDKVLSKNRVIAGFDHDKRSEPYRQLRTQVLQKLRANSWKTLAVTSPNDGAGKSVTAVNLAIALSKEVNQTVLLIDLDFRNPTVHKLLGIEPSGGLIDHLKGEKDLSELMLNPNMERLVLLPGKQDKSYTSEILSTPKMYALLKDVTTRYESRIIIFDIPSLLVNDDALIFTPYVDAALLVIEEGVTTPDQLEESMKILEGTNFLGAVLNKSES